MQEQKHPISNGVLTIQETVRCVPEERSSFPLDTAADDELPGCAIAPSLNNVGVPESYKALIWRRQLNKRPALFCPRRQIIIICNAKEEWSSDCSARNNADRAQWAF